MSAVILHHYDISPYAEKIRLVLGLKRLAWSSVIQPMVMPKPDLTVLTGGFRRIPVLQIGADVYCDTNLIAAELEQRFPKPTIYPEGRIAETEIWCTWAERVLMWPTARYVTAVNDDRLGAPFHADRAAMRGHPPPSAAELAASIPHQRAQCRQMIGWLDSILAGRSFLLGDEPGLADFAVYQRIWWLGAFGGRARDVLDGHDALRSWADRIAMIGHGTRSEIGASSALDVARDAQPPVSQTGSQSMHGRFSVGTEGFAPDPVSGELIAMDDHSIAIAHESERVGRVIVHFPKLGYEWRKLPMPAHAEVPLPAS